MAKKLPEFYPEELKVGDTFYEYSFGLRSYLKSTVLTLPEKNENGSYRWDGKVIVNGREQVTNYLYTPGLANFYGPWLSHELIADDSNKETDHS